MDRAEHVEWCKERAGAYLDSGDIQNAFASMGSDLNKHDETRDHAAIGLGMQMMMIGGLNTVEKMRKFINGFN